MEALHTSPLASPCPRCSGRLAGPCAIEGLQSLLQPSRGFAELLDLLDSQDAPESLLKPMRPQCPAMGEAPQPGCFLIGCPSKLQRKLLVQERAWLAQVGGVHHGKHNEPGVNSDTEGGFQELICRLIC